MTPPNSYSLQRTMIIYILLIGFAALLVASEFVLDTHSTALKLELTRNFQQYASGELAEDQVYEPLVKIRNKAMMMVGVILAVVVIVLTMFIKTITEPLQHMVEVSKAISAGDLSQTTGVESKNELSQLSAAIDDMSTNLQEIIMLSRSVCDSANRVTTNTMGLMKDEQLDHGKSDAMEQQLARLESELTMLGQVIDFFKLYSVENQPWPG
ncbi:HAMP domain-containing protein [uncultured Desulfosarcina sp.]|uniref:HAMP domain-containing protein n=1 Tax=uncultured Desulfosarcina sp. TaxID=218289 RepID=UPI0029C91CF5|nr:HAMP domain-containing protein [uncultured Desulfosarcina sp.]